MSHKLLIMSVLVLAGVAVVAVVLFFKNTANQQLTPIPVATSISTNTPISTSSATAYPANWEEYNNEDIGFSLAWPPKMSVTEREDIPGTTAINFTLIGETQTQGTELFDGISITFTSGMFQESFDKFVESEYERQQNEPTTSEISDLRETKITNYNGYTFDVVSLGDYTHIYLPKVENEYLHIYYIAPDPEGQGYSDIVDTMLSNFQIIE